MTCRSGGISKLYHAPAIATIPYASNRYTKQHFRGIQGISTSSLGMLQFIQSTGRNDPSRFLWPSWIYIFLSYDPIIDFYDETVHRHRANVNNTLDRSYYRDDRLVEKSGGHILNWTPRLKQPYSYGKLHACKCAVAIREKEECFSLRM